MLPINEPRKVIDSFHHRSRRLDRFSSLPLRLLRPKGLSHAALRYGLAAACTVAATWLHYVLQNSVGFTFVFITFYPAVMLAAVVGGSGPGALTTLLSATCADYFFIEPRGALAVQSPSDAIALAAFVATGLGLSGLVALMQRRNKENAARFWGWLETAPDGIVVVSPAGTIVFANRQLEKLFGYDEDELLGHPIEKLVPQRFHKGHYASRKHYVAAPVPRVMGMGPRTCGLRKDGSEFPADISLSPLNFDGKVLVCSMVRDISDRLKAEVDLKTGEERFRVALKNSPVVVFNQDRELRYTWINNPVFVWAEQGWLGRTDMDILEPESAARLTAIKRRVLETGAGVREEVHVSREGKTVYYDLTVEPLRDAAGEVVGITCASTDVTERKASEKAIHDREAQLNAFFDSSPAGMALLGTDLRFLRVNEPLARINGPKVEEHLGRTIDEVLPALSPTLKPMFEKIITNGESFLNLEVTGEVPGAPGETRHWLVSYFPVKDQQGKATAAGGVVIDITETKRMEDALLKERDFVEALLENLAEGIVACDANGRLTRFNRASEKIHGLEAEAVPPERWAEHYDIYLSDQTTHPSMEEVPLFRALQGEHVKDAEFMVMPKCGEPRFVSVSGGPIVDSEGQRLGAVIAMRDITEHKRLEEQLLQSQKLEAIGRLAGGVAHDFNNIMGVIQGYAELLQERLPNGETAKHVAAIRNATGRATALTRQLLAFSRRQMLQPKVVSLNQVAMEVSHMLQRLIGENIEVVLKTAPDLGMVNVDAIQIEQVLINLAVNARDAMPKGGRLVIATSNTELDSEYARTHAAVEPGEYVMISVTDNGVGMNAETLSHVFEPFFTTKSLGKGTGLGLSIVYGIVRQSGGHIWAYSEPGKGTTFQICLPRVANEKTEAEIKVPSIRANNAASAISETILVVEDEAALAEMTRSVLENSGYCVLLAGSAEEALKIAQKYEGEIHLVLTDVVLRGQMDGTELAKLLSGVRPQAKVVLMSGYSDVLVDRVGAIQPALLLEKPFTAVQLRAALRKALGGGL
jgi:two-component system, cell cycle sensor histidine kinase and response regulator CckA